MESKNNVRKLKDPVLPLAQKRLAAKPPTQQGGYFSYKADDN